MIRTRGESTQVELIHSKSAHVDKKVHPVLPVASTTAMSRYFTYLKKLYIRSKHPIKGKWPPSFCKKVIKLVTVEKCSTNTFSDKVFHSKFESLDQIIQDTKVTRVKLNDLLTSSDGSHHKCVIVQGAPGIGKSTFAWKVCRKWGKGRLFQEFDLVILLRMRDTYVREAKNLTDLFYSSDVKLSRDVAQEVIEKGGEGVLFIFEGIDELPSSVLSDDNSVLMGLLQGVLLPDVTIIVTSRPWAVQSLIEKCGEQISQYIEILGFTAEDIMHYISHSFSDDEQKEIQQYVLSQPHFLNIMYVPLNSAIVVQIYKQRKRTQQSVPKTMTQLYTALIQSLILRNVKSSFPEYKNLKLSALDTLPEPLLKQFHQLCKVAFAGFTSASTQVVFNESDLPCGVDSLGLMQSNCDFSAESGSLLTHTFLHITIQEFLAAYHVSLQSEELALSFIRDHLHLPLYTVLLRIFAGLTHFGKPFWSSVLSLLYSRDCIVLHNPEFTHWLNEAQSPDLCEGVLNAKRIDYIPTDQVSLFDTNALLYCMQHSSSTWDLRFFLNMHDSQQFIGSHESTCMVTTCDTTNVSAARIRDLCLCTSNRKVASAFLHSIPSSYFRELNNISIFVARNPEIVLDTERLDIGSITAKSSLECSEGLPLERFRVVNAFLGEGGAVPILKALQFPFSCISSIILCRTQVGYPDILELCEILITSSTLEDLDLADNSLSSECLQHLFNALASGTTSLDTLDISGNVLSPCDAELLSIALSVNQSLLQLDLNSCSINAEAATRLATGIAKNNTLRYLYMRDNCVGLQGVCSLGNMLQENAYLEVLYFCGDSSIQTVGAEVLIQSLGVNDVSRKSSLGKHCEPPQIDMKSSDQSSSIPGEKTLSHIHCHRAMDKNSWRVEFC